MNLKEQKEIVERKLEEINLKLGKKKNTKVKGKTKFYHFNQNNSGGSFDEDEDVCPDIFIEAHDYKEANLLADNFGIYFDGCNQGIDCSCCGDRWSECWSEDSGSKNPKIYGKDIRKMYKELFREKAIIHYLDGTKEVVIFKDKNDGHKHVWKQQYNIGKQCKICNVWENEIKRKLKK